MQKVMPKYRQTGWYLEAGGGAQSGANFQVFFPLAPLGHISNKAAPRLEGEQGFKLTHGQWQWLHLEYVTHGVKALGFTSDNMEEHQAIEEYKLEATVAPQVLIEEATDLVVGDDDSKIPGLMFRHDHDDDNKSLLPVLDGTPSDADIQQLITSVVEKVSDGCDKAMHAKLAKIASRADAHERFLCQELAEAQKSNALLLSELKHHHWMLPKMDNLLNQIEILKQKVDASATGLDGSHVFSNEDKSMLDDLAFEIWDWHATLSSAISKEMKDKKATGGKILCHGVSFGSMHEATVWFDNNSLKISMFADAKALASCIQPVVVSQEMVTKSMEAKHKVDIHSNLEVLVIMSLAGVIPPVLAGGKTELEGSAYECLIGYQKTYNKWNLMGQGKGLKGHLSAGICAAQKHIEVLHRDGHLLGKAHTLAVGLLNDSIRFLDEHINWKSTSFRELLEDTTLMKETVWQMFLECEAKIWVDIADAGSQYINAAWHSHGYYL
jgi:hypothetical protein